MCLSYLNTTSWLRDSKQYIIYPNNAHQMLQRFVKQKEQKLLDAFDGSFWNQW